MTDVSLAQELVRLTAAAGLGGVIGLERELRAQPAGFRTHLLVAQGAALFTVVGADVAGAEPTRVAAQVVSGIGFLGAGAILRNGGSVHGLTTAASLWISAAAGLACGLGRMSLAAFAVGLALLALTGLKYLEREFFPRRRGHPVLVHASSATDLRVLLTAVTGVLGSVEVQAVARAGDEGTTLRLTAPLPARPDLVDLAMQLRALDGVVGVELDV